MKVDDNIIETQPIILTDGVNISVDASLGTLFRVTLGGNRTLANPINLIDGQQLTFEIIQDATGFRILNLDTKYVGFLPYLYAAPPNTRFFATFRYNATADKLYLEKCWTPSNQPQKQFLPREQLIAEGGNCRNLHFNAHTNVGTPTQPALAATNLHTSLNMVRLTSAATANAASEMRVAFAPFWRGNAVGLGGFYAQWTWAMNSTTLLQRLAVGLWSATGATSTSQVPSNLTNCLFVGNDSADTTLQVMHNDGSGTCTKIDLGANFPASNTTAVYRSTFWCYPNDSTVYYEIERLDTGVVVSGSLTTNLPPNNTFLAPHAYMNNGGTAAAVVLDIRSFANFALQ